MVGDIWNMDSSDHIVARAAQAAGAGAGTGITDTGTGITDSGTDSA